MITLSVSTNQRVDFVDITSRVREAVASGGVQDGIVTVYVPHTTCGVTINESDDPNVAADITMQLAKLVPHHAGYAHYEDNADSHIKTSLVDHRNRSLSSTASLSWADGRGSSYAILMVLEREKYI